MMRYQISITEQNDERGRTWAYEITRDGRPFMNDNGFVSHIKATQQAYAEISAVQQKEA